MDLMQKLIALTLMLLSFSVFSGKIAVTGEPIILEKRQSIYLLPSGFKALADSYYVSMDGTNHVCFIEKQPSLTGLNSKMVNVVVNGHIAPWVCYPFDDNYFMVGH